MADFLPYDEPYGGDDYEDDLEDAIIDDPFEKEVPDPAREQLYWPMKDVLPKLWHPTPADEDGAPEEATSAREFERHMADAVAAATTGARGAPSRIPELLNELALFTRASPYGDTNDLYYHAPSNRVAVNYSPASQGVLEPPPTASSPKKAKKEPAYPVVRPQQPRRPSQKSPDSPLKAPEEVFPDPEEQAPGEGVRSELEPEEREALAAAIARYYFYVEKGVDEAKHIAPPRPEWAEHVLELVPPGPPRGVSQEYYDDLVESAMAEMEGEYYASVKRAIVDYVLCSPTERERLGLVELAPLVKVPGSPAQPHGELPDVWRNNVDAAREDIAWTLQTLSPNILELATLWEGFKSKLLVDCISPEFLGQQPFQADAFRAFETDVCEHVKGMLWNTWVNKSVEVFRRSPPVCISGDSDAYYRAVAVMQSNELRTLVQDSLDQYVAFFKGHQPTEEQMAVDPQQDKHMWSVPPCFTVQLVPGKGGYLFSPSFHEVEDVVKGVMESFVTAVSGIPRMGNSQTSMSRRGAHIPAVGLDEHCVEVARKAVLEVMEANREAPRLLANLYGSYTYLLSMDVPNYLQRFLEGNHSLDEYAEEIDKLRETAENIQATSLSEVRTGVYVVQCGAFKEALVNAALDVANQLLDQVRRAAAESNNEICDAFNKMNTRLLVVPETGEDVLAQEKYIQQSIAHQDVLKQEIAVNKEREVFLFRYQYEVPEVDFALAVRTYELPTKMVELMKEAKDKANAEHKAFEEELRTRRSNFTELLLAYETEINTLEAAGDEGEHKKRAEQTNDLSNKLKEAQTDAEEINTQEKLFGWQQTKFVKLGEMISKLEPYLTLWTITSQLNSYWGQWMGGLIAKLDPEEIEETVGDFFRRVFKLCKFFGGQSGGPTLEAPLAVAEATKKRVDDFKVYIPLLHAVCNQGLRPRHWKQMSEITPIEINKDTHNLASLIQYRVHEHVEALTEISDFASREWSFEKTLHNMQKAWEGLCFELNDWKSTGTYILKGGPVDEAQALLDDHIIKTQAMRASPFAKEFENETGPWEQTLTRLQDIMDQWLKCQGKWIYLEPIFGSEEIMSQIPKEGAAFRDMDKTWRTIMERVKTDPDIIRVARMESLLEDLTAANQSLDVVEKGLNDFLDTKKLAFPRFFFLSNDELLEILSEAKDPLKVQPFMKKCFEAIKEVEFTPRVTMTKMVSVEGEVVPLAKEIDPAETGAVEKWMLEFEDVMKDSIQKVMGESVASYPTTPREKWILDWPGQIVLGASQVFWTKATGDAIREAGSQGLRNYADTCTKQLMNIVNMVRGELTKLERATLSALIVIDVHARDTLSLMADQGVEADTDFNWLSQLRYYWEDNTMRVRMINAVATYGYEYLGNSSRLVITPLTDRCYRTLMGAIHLNLGGAPAGPAGTGKTETTKDLSKAIAIQCVVFNCSDGLDYKAMGKFFKGLAASGAWACFDEFNRIELEVLSVVAQQVLTIQLAVKAGVDKFTFEGVELRLIRTCNVFITMNPGYAGRSELPDNLKALFRDVAMMVPDYAMIAEIILYSYGYLQARDMARKLVQTYRLCSEQLSSQDHYDYGMRAVISVLRAAGNLKRKFGDEAEDVLMLRAITDVNLPKFLDQDVPLFRGILSDLFPGVDLPEIDYNNLTDALKSQCKKLNLQPLDTFFEKIIQLYEMIIVRHGLMVVGWSFGMKTCMYRVLAGALSELKKKNLNGEQHVKYYVLNPKSITMGQLYGCEDPVSKEWTDGILAVNFRNAARDTSPDRKWVMFDGPVDAIWIENMNTVLDDNKKLCLNSGEIIAMQGLMNMIFEVQDLAVASPATVSRCGMVYVQPSLLGWRPIMESWLNTMDRFPALTAAHKEQMAAMFDWLVPPMVRVATKECKMPQPCDEINLVNSLMQLYESVMDEFKSPETISGMNENIVAVWIDSLFLFSLVWAVGGVVDEDGRKKFDSTLRKILVGDVPAHLKVYMKGAARKVTQLFPEGKLVYDFQFDKTKSKWIPWLETIEETPISDEAEYSQIIVTTMDTVRYNFLIETLITHNKQMLMVGPTGTGKSVYIKNFISGMDDNKWSYIFMNFSAQTSANMTQDIIDGKLDKRKKGVFGPPVGKNMVVFVDDLNMPQVEEYGAQPPIELLRQFMDHSGWFDRKELTFRQLIDMQFIAAMGPPGGGRNNVTNRYLRHFCCISVTQFTGETMNKIFSTLVDWWMKKSNFGQNMTKLRNPLISATIEIFETVQRELLPTPVKSHYTYNLRDVSKVFQGISGNKTNLEDGPQLVRLWIHETLRVFSDRLVDETDRDWMFKNVQSLTESHFKEKFSKLLGRLDKNKDGSVDLQELRTLMFGDFMIPGADPKVYTEIQDQEQLLTVVNEYLAEFNATSKKPMHLVMFLYALEHVCRICRIIKQPGGHGLLVGVGGSGRQSLTRLAAFIQEYEVHQIEISKNYGKAEWGDDLKKVIRMAGEANKQTVFLFADTQIAHEYFVEDLSNLLNTAEVPNLLESGDLVQIFENISGRAKQVGMHQNRTQLYNFFLSEVRKNLHICLAFSPVGDAFRERLRKFPSLVTCTTIDWFSAWPEDALYSVAKNFLQEAAVEEDLKLPLANVCVNMHQSVQQMSQRFLEETRRYFYVTPTSYLELITSYKTMLGKKQSEVSTVKKRYEIGLEKLLATEESVAGMQQELVDLQPKLVQSSKETDEALVVIAAETEEADKVRSVVSKEEAIASNEAAKVQAIKDECEGDLAEAMPMLESALKALDTLTPGDITEVKGMKSPPAVVKLVMESVCVMKGLKAARVKDKDSGKMVDDYWEVSKKMLMESGFLQSLKSYDKDNIPPATITKIKVYVANPDFTPEVVLKASKAAYGLCCWVRAMESYDRVAKVVGPKKIALAQAEADLEIVMGGLREKQEALKKVEDKISALNSDLATKQALKAKLEADVELCTVKLDRAQKLISGLGGEKTRWTAAAERLGEQYTFLTGDVLLAAAFIAYLGAFSAGYRESATKGWTEVCIAQKIPCNSEFTLIDTLGEPVKIRAWNIQGLPKDDFSSENGIIVDLGRRWPLFIDPQGQANKWVREMEKERGLKIIKLTDGDYLRTLENCVQFGKPVLLENVPEALDASLEPLLLKQTFKQGGAMCIRLGDATVEYSADFKFYITTKLRNPHCAPELCTKVSLVNFTLVLEGLEDQLLGAVVKKERPDLAKEKDNLIIQGAENKKQLKEIEDKILEVLSSSEGNILEDEGAVQILSASKVLSDEISEKQKVADITEQKIDETRAGYRPVARHCSLLFFCVADMANIDPMYQYSLGWFQNLYLKGIDEAAQADDLSKRLQNIMDHYTYMLFKNVCRSLFEKDKVLFAFLMATRLLLADGKMDAGELRFLLTGGVGMDNPHANPADWLTAKGWDELCRMADLPNVKTLGTLREDFAADTASWKAVYDAADAHLHALPSPWHDRLSPFQRMLVIRCLRPDKVVPAITQYVEKAMGKRYVEPIPFRIEDCFADSEPGTPLIFVLSPGSDPMAGLLKFASDRNNTHVEPVSLGQGQGPIAAKWLEKGMEKGFWVVLQNCHLAKSFMPQLEAICEVNIKSDKVHPDFRVWLTSYPSPIFPITILENGVKMTNEAPKGLRAGLTRTYMMDPVSDSDFFNGCNKEATWRKMLFGLAFFHTSLQERRKFGPVGFNIPYEFNENDLRICVRQLQMFINDNEELPIATLSYTCGECNYGGKVTDGHDRHTVMTILKRFYNADIVSDGYALSESGQYKVPAHTGYDGYLEFINKIPLLQAPEVYGLHANADITKDIADTSQMLDTFMLTQSRDSSGGGETPEDVMGAVAQDILARLPANFDLEAAERTYPVDYYESMNTVLTQELGRVNTLLDVIRSSLINLGKAIKGLILLSDDLDKVGKSLFDSKVPAMWLKKSFPSLKPLAAYIRDVIDRCQFFQKWVDEGVPVLFPLPAFFFTQAFLTGAKQNFARKHKIEIDKIDFEFIVKDGDPSEYAEKPEDGVYVGEFFMDACDWDYEAHQLTECQPKVLVTPCPPMLMMPTETTKFRKYSYYNAPLYKTPDRRGILSTTGHSTNFVMDVKMPCAPEDEHGRGGPDHWTLRGAALMLSQRD